MKTLRVDIHGLVGLELHKYLPSKISTDHRADHLSAFCLDPRLVDHVPYLIVAAIDVDGMATTLHGDVVKDRIRFDVSGYNLTLDFDMPGTSGVKLPQDTIEEQGDVDMGPLAKHVPDMAALTGFSKLQADFKWPCPHDKVVSAFLIETGSVRARVASRWTFWIGDTEEPNCCPEEECEESEENEENEEEKPSEFCLQMDAADIVSCYIPVRNRVRIVATPRKGGETKYLEFLDAATSIRVFYEHLCEDEAECGKTIGTQFEVFYDLLERHYRRPRAMRSQSTDTGYCPPTLFWD
jgi:hypothetical protein